MKKIVYVLSVACLLATTGCSKQNEALVLRQSLSFNVGEEVRFEADMPVTWRSTHPFIVEVDEQGKVAAKHVGRAEVIAATSTRHTACVVEVKPRYLTIVEPCYELIGQPKSAVIAKETRKLVGNSEVELIYEGKETYVEFINYSITPDTEVVNGAEILIMNSRKEEVMSFLEERYAPITQPDGTIVGFQNDYPGKATIEIEITHFETKFSLRYEAFVAPE